LVTEHSFTGQFSNVGRLIQGTGGSRIGQRHHTPALDFYETAFGPFLFVSPWLFAYVSEEARVEVWAAGAAIAAISIAAIVAFSDWEEWVNVLLGLWLLRLRGFSGLSTPARCMSAFRSASWSRFSQHWSCGWSITSPTMIRGSRNTALNAMRERPHKADGDRQNDVLLRGTSSLPAPGIAWRYSSRHQ
jgi:hypothetical protein